MSPDEVSEIERRLQAGYSARTKSLALAQAKNDVWFLIRAVRQAESASRGFIEAICAGVLVPRKKKAKP